MAENSDGRDTSADHANVRAIFQQWDPTGHGTLQKEELLSILSDIGITDRELAAMLKTTDACRDQNIHYSDFLRWVFAPASSPESGHQAGVSSQRTEPNASVPDGFGCEVEPEADETEIENCGDILQAAEGNVGAVRRLLQMDPQSLEQVDEDGNGPLAIAASEGHLEVVEALLAAGASVEAKNDNGNGPLAWAAWGGHLEVVEALLAAGASVEAKDSDGDGPLAWAAAGEVVEALLAAGASIEAKNNNGSGPLLIAALNAHLQVVEALLAAGASVDAKDDKGDGPLAIAALNGHLEVVEALLAAGASVEAKNDPGDGPLAIAAQEGHLEVVEALLAAGASVEAKNDNGTGPLHFAARGGHPEVVEALLAAGASVEAKNEYGTGPLHFAAWGGHPEVVEALLAAGASVEAKDRDGTGPLHFAARGGHPEVVEALLAAGASVEAKNKFGTRPLHFVAQEGHLEVVEALLAAGASVEAKNDDGDGPLHFAARGGHPEVVEALLAAGASVEAKNDNGNEPLLSAAHNGHLEVVEALLAAGASVDAKDDKGDGPLAWPAWGGHLEVVEALLAAGASVEAKSDKGFTPLHWAALNGHTAAVEQLLAAGAAVDAATSDGQTPLHGAAAAGHTAVVEQLLAAGAAVDAVSNAGETPLHHAAKIGRTAVVKQLLAAGAAVDAVSNAGQTPLHGAAATGCTAVEQLLAAVEAAVNNEGQGAPAFNGHTTVVEQLLAAGAAVDAVDKGGHTPYDRAKQNDRRQVMGFLDPVFVALLSGRSCRCNSAHETVQDVKEEAERKLGTTIEHLIGPDMQPLTGAMRLEEANILPGNTLTAVIDVIDLPSQPAEGSAPVQEDPLVVKDVGHGIFIKTNQSIFDAHMLKIDVLDSWSGLKDPSSLEKALPSGHVLLSHLIRLHPEDVTFPLPVEVEMPTFVGAATVWRSSTRGWAPVEDATFGDGRVTVKLDHFCDMAVTGQCHVKAVGFILPQGAAAKVALLHVACGTCQKGLEQLCSDPDVLNCFSRCGPSVALGTYHHKEEIQLHQAGQIMKMKVKFNRMPLVSAPLLAESGRHFSVEIDGDDHRFEDPTPSNAAAGLADVQQFAAAATPNLETSQSAAASQATPSAAAWLGGENGSAATDATADAQQLPAASTALGTSQHSAPATEAMASAVPRPERCHLLLSGRFNCERTMNYMRTVKRRLEQRRVPVFMVQAQVGQSFAELTRIGLAHAKGMVAFCTSDYGAYTGAGYETFHELEYAHDNKLQIFPIRLCEEWPPAPQDNPRGSRGTFQNRLVFKNGLVYVDDRQMNNAEGAADQIADSVTSPGGIFSN